MCLWLCVTKCRLWLVFGFTVETYNFLYMSKIPQKQLNRLYLSVYLSRLFLYLLSLCDVFFFFTDWKVNGDV